MSREPDLALGIDVGMGTTKVVLADACGEILWQADSSYQYQSPRPEWAEQDPDDSRTGTSRTETSGVAKYASWRDARELRRVARRPASALCEGAVESRSTGTNPMTRLETCSCWPSIECQINEQHCEREVGWQERSSLPASSLVVHHSTKDNGDCR
jgi:hypothetical protein